MFLKLKTPVKYVIIVTNVQRIIISYMLIPQIKRSTISHTHTYITRGKLREK
jgi:hypothetical protein